MKKYFLFILLIAVSNSNYAQTKHEISFLYGKSTGPATYSVLRSGFLDGASSGSLKENNSISLRYINYIKNNKLSIETGIDYLTGKLEIEPALTGEFVYNAPWEEQINLTSIPVYINHYFWKYFYMNEGVMLDFQNTDKNNYTGIGLGIGFGIGARYNYNNFTFYLNPIYRKHLFLSKKYGLVEWGIKLGIGYKF